MIKRNIKDRKSTLRKGVQSLRVGEVFSSNWTGNPFVVVGHMPGG